MFVLGLDSATTPRGEVVVFSGLVGVLVVVGVILLDVLVELLLTFEIDDEASAWVFTVGSSSFEAVELNVSVDGV